MSATHDPARPGGATLTAFAMATVLGGGNFIGVRFSNRELDPLWGATLRFALAALLFVTIVLVMRLRWPRGRVLLNTAVYGLLSFGLFYALMYWALVRVTAGVATVVMAMVPLVTLLLAAAHGMERLGSRQVAGAVLAVVGIGWISTGPDELAIPPLALGAMILAIVCVGESVILGKKVSANHPAMTNAVAMATGAVVLATMSAVAGDRWILPQQPEVRWAVGYLVTLGSVGLFVLILLVVRTWSASATSYMFVLFPIVTMLLGAAAGDERLTVRGVTGALVVMAGVWFGALAPRATPAVEPA
ncbi:MAG TPA: EamA family transporter [Acidimicrobiia bacterium]|nr:EamA family transporter [Acidimicrobiia bacterium]